MFGKQDYLQIKQSDIIIWSENRRMNDKDMYKVFCSVSGESDLYEMEDLQTNTSENILYKKYLIILKILSSPFYSKAIVS